MQTGGFSTVLREKILRFNGGLFEDATARSRSPTTNSRCSSKPRTRLKSIKQIENDVSQILTSRASTRESMARQETGDHISQRLCGRLG